MISKKHIVLALSFIVLPLIYLSTVSAGDAERVVIVVNSNDPSSIEIGEYYAQQRGIPSQNIIQLQTSSGETITPKEYVETIYNPLLTELINGDWVQGVRSEEADRFGRRGMSVAVNKVSYLVTIRGVPLRISNEPALLEADLGKLPKQFHVNQGSVDGELALLLAPSAASMTAFIQNPFFEKKQVASTDLSRWLRVSRLDGPSASSIMKLIDRTLEAERTGLMGRAYIDQGGPHVKGDEWISAAGDLAEAAYFDTQFETSKSLMNMSDRYDGPAIYMGWYTHNAYGPWAQPRWSVPPGAIGFHLHSYSATTVRDAKKRWLGAFVAQGYCATMGNVYEPYLDLTHRPHRLLEHLLDGHTFGEAILYSNPALSWMGVAIGDPLYRPFKVDLAAQIASEPQGPYSTYVYIREVNRLKAEEGVEAAINYARARFVTQPTLPLGYKLSRLYSVNGQTQEAAEALKIIRYITVFEADEQVLVAQIADQLYELGESKLALEVYERLIAQPNLKKTLRISLLEGGAKVAATAGSATQSSRWSIEARQLKAPPAPKQPAK